jgi:2,2-dialkylglycine decarboxylase (pyruvate)
LPSARREISDAGTDVVLELGLSANIARARASGGVMRIVPPLTVSEAEVDLLGRRLDGLL